MARVKGGLFTTTLDVNKRFPLDSRMLVTKREDLINPTIWITNTLTTESTYNGMIVAVNSDGEYNGVYYLTNRTAITADNYSAYKTALANGENVDTYFSMWKKLGTLDDVITVENKIKELIADIKPSMNLVPVDGTIVISNTEDDNKAIGVAIASIANNALVAVEGGLFVPTVSAGTGIEMADNTVSVKLADVTHGLVAVDGALTLNLATRKSDGAMSKEDKLIVDSIPYAYEARKYDISGAPAGTLVDYRNQEIRIMCPADAEFTKQTVGADGDANTYYITFKTFVPNDNVIGYIEHLNGQSDSEILTAFSTDEYGRRYQPTWLGLAKYDEVADTWTYYGKNSSVDKYIGWDYQIDWYDANNKIIASNSVRINLSNENCHYNNKPYYMASYATVEEVATIKETLSSVEKACTWSEM